MSNLLEIRYHGRGGQGAKTLAFLFAEVALTEKNYVQAFLEYGPERAGAPVQAFVRLSSQPIDLHCAITRPDIAVVLDSTLIETIDIAEGLSKNGLVIINSAFLPHKARKQIKLKKGKLYTVDASLIAKETIGLNIPNMPMLGALVKVVNFIKIEKVLKNVRQNLKEKFINKPEVIDGNIEAIKRAYYQVRGESLK